MMDALVIDHLANAPERSSLSVNGTIRRGAFALNVDLQIPTGITVIWGRSGAGKSTLLEALAGFAPFHGTMLMHDATTGPQPWHLGHRSLCPTRSRRIGVVSQRPSLLPHLSVLDNVAFKATKALAEAALARVGALELAHRSPATLSGGQVQRVQLARALAHQSRVLLLDEPFAHLDSPTRKELGTLTKLLVEKEQLLAVVVTHDEHEAARLSPHVISVDRGQASHHRVVAGAGKQGAA